jgi:hypothetical protein
VGLERASQARENSWGYQPIRGELLKLGVTRSKGCVADILRRNGLPPLPQRRALTWQQFLSRHAEVMLCADLFTKEVWTFRAPDANAHAERWVGSVTGNAWTTSFSSE